MYGGRAEAPGNANYRGRWVVMMIFENSVTMGQQCGEKNAQVCVVKVCEV